MVIARRRSIAFTILALGILFTSAQVIAYQEPSTVWPLEVKEFQVSLVNVVSQQANGGAAMPNNTMPGGMMMPDMVKAESKQLLLALKCKNITQKQTSVIFWESRFTDVAERLIIKQYKSRKKIKPGKDEMIEEPLAYDLRKIPNSIKMGFRIMKVEFTDNTTWEDCTKDLETCFVYKNYILQ
jgi:hypothetical protein